MLRSVKALKAYTIIANDFKKPIMEVCRSGTL